MSSYATTKYEGLSDPATSCKIGVVLLGIIFLKAELKTHKMTFMHCSLQIKQNIY